MERIGVRELRQHASTYLDRVKVGETIEVTEHGRLVALLVPPTGRDTWDRLVATGQLLPGSGDPLEIDPLPAVAGQSASERLAQMREEER